MTSPSSAHFVTDSKYDSAAAPVTLESMRVVVGIPTKNESATISDVTSVIDAGLSADFPGAQCWIVNADNGSADNTAGIFSSTPTVNRKHSINTGGENTGKGTNVLAVLEFAHAVEADVVVFIDGDVRSVRSDWVTLLAERALRHQRPAFVTPQYVRNRYEANTTNQLVRPYLRAAFGLDISQPIGGEFAMNRAFVTQALRWQRFDSTNLYGIDVWLTVNAALSGVVMEHVEMGRKIHNPTFPKIFRLGEQVLDTLFRLMMEQRPARPTIATATTDELFIDEEATRLPAHVVEPILERSRAYLAHNLDEVLLTFPTLHVVAWRDGLPFLGTETWAQILTDSYRLIDPHSFRRIRNHVVALFPARVVSYWNEIEGFSHNEVEQLLRFQNDRVVELFMQHTIPTEPVSTATMPELDSQQWEEATQVA